MISCKCIGSKGRFGNQLFQFCSGWGIADKLGFEFKIPSNGHRLKECFDMSSTFFAQNQVLKFKYRERKIGFDPFVYKILDNTDIDGWFQSEKYFAHISEQIKKTLKFREDLEAKANKIWNELSINKPTVSIHVRRSDYLNDPVHPPCQKEYYEVAKKLFEDHIFFVFSDIPLNFPVA